MFGNPETTTGGRALKFYASVRIDIRRIAAVKEGDQVVGSRTRVKIVKNKVAAPFREAEFDILYGEGISREGDVLDQAVLHNIVEKSGAWFSFSGERIGQGRENVRQYLKDNKDTFNRIETALRQKLGISRSRRQRCATGSGKRCCGCNGGGKGRPQVVEKLIASEGVPNGAPFAFSAADRQFFMFPYVSRRFV